MDNVSASFSLNSSKWKLSEDVQGPAIAFFVTIVFLLSLPPNLFVIIHSVYYGWKNFRKCSIILLFSYALSDLLMTLLYMPFTIAASGAGEWIFGTTDNTRDILCQIHGFVFAYLVMVSSQTLAVISVDRFLYIVKSNVYFKIMTWKVGFALMAIIWVSSP